MKSLKSISLVRAAYARIMTARSRLRINRLLRLGKPIMLDIGSGAKSGVNGWTTVDMIRICDIYCDLRKGIPFPNDSVARIYMSHFLEHLAYEEIRMFLAECYRVLAIDGVLAIAVPDAALYVAAYNKMDTATLPPVNYAPGWHNTTSIDYLNYIAYMNGHHKHMFDGAHLVYVLTMSGFRDVHLRPFDKSLDLEERRSESLYAAALK